MSEKLKTSWKRNHIGVISYPYTARIDSGNGIDRYAAELLRNLDEKRFGIELIPGSGPKWGLCGRLSDELSFPFQLHSSKADLFHAIHPMGGKTAALLKKRPLITSIHDNLSFEFSGFGRRYTQVCDAISVKMSDSIIVSSDFLKKFLVGRLGVEEDKIEVVYYGVNHDVYYPQPEIRKNRNLILFVSGLNPRRGAYTLLHAINIAKEDIPDVKLLVGGVGEALTDMKKISKDLGIIENVNFLGFIPENKLPDYYTNAGIFIYPSQIGFGLQTLEAMACGTPVISSNVLDTPDYLGDSAILIDPKDEHKLAEAILRLLSNDSLYQKLVKKGLERVKKFSWKKMASETQCVYQEVLSG